jgi:hypothetical protein
VTIRRAARPADRAGLRDAGDQTIHRGALDDERAQPERLIARPADVFYTEREAEFVRLGIPRGTKSYDD